MLEFAKSAMVRETFNILSYARAESESSSMAFLNNLDSSSPIRQCSRIRRWDIPELHLVTESAKRSNCIRRHGATLCLTVSELSLRARSCNSSIRTAGASMWMSIRSRSGPLTRARYFLDLWGGATTFTQRVAQVSTRAWVHGGNKHETAWKSYLSRTSWDSHLTILQRLPEDFEGGTLKLR